MHRDILFDDDNSFGDVPYTGTCGVAIITPDGKKLVCELFNSHKGPHHHVVFTDGISAVTKFEFEERDQLSTNINQLRGMSND